MNWLDIIIIITFVASIFAGLATGIIRAATSLAGLILAIILAGRFYETAGSWLGFISNENIANLLGFIAIVIIVLAVTYIVGGILRTVIKNVMLGWLDRLLGGITGFLIALVAWSLLLALWVKFLGGSLVADSFFAQLLLEKLPFILALLPAQFETVKKFFG